jgi:hypothetical protein
MYNGVNGLIRKPDSLPPVVSPDQLRALGFIELDSEIERARLAALFVRHPILELFLNCG